MPSGSIGLRFITSRSHRFNRRPDCIAHCFLVIADGSLLRAFQVIKITMLHLFPPTVCINGTRAFLLIMIPTTRRLILTRKRWTISFRWLRTSWKDVKTSYPAMPAGLYFRRRTRHSCRLPRWSSDRNCRMQGFSLHKKNNFYGSINEDNYLDYMTDYIHFNDAGRALLADRFVQCIFPNLIFSFPIRSGS